jgi:hypothetical protein
MVKWRIMDIPTTFTWVSIFVNRAFDDSGIFSLLRWMQNLHHLTWDHEMLYTDRPSKQLLTRPLSWKIKIDKNMVDGWNLKFTFCFMITNHRFYLDKQLRYDERSRTYLQFFMWIIIFFDVALERGDGGIFNSWGERTVHQHTSALVNVLPRNFVC